MKTLGWVEERIIKIIINDIISYEKFHLDIKPPTAFTPNEIYVLNYALQKGTEFNISDEIIELCKAISERDINDTDILYLYSISLLEKLYNENQNTIKKL